MSLLARIAVVALLLPGCALLSTRHPARLRYFTPETTSVPDAAPTRDDAGPTLELRLARVDAAEYIQDRIAFRDDSAEVGYYHELRWAEPPEAWLRRALARALFQGGAVHEIVTGAGPVLEVDLDSFEELRAPRHAARVVVTWRLRSGRIVERQRTVTVEHPIDFDGADRVANADAIAGAIAAALDDLVAGIVVDVVGELGALAVRAPSAGM